MGFVDIHCHVLPKVDDGSTSMEMSIEMLKMLYAEGVSVVVLTPHHRHGYANAPVEVLNRQFLALEELAAKEVPGIQLVLGAEVHYASDMMDELFNGTALTINGTRYVLTEFLPNTSFREMEGTCRSLLMNGFKPIIAHAERYQCLVKDPVLVQDLVDMGSFIQVNTGSVIGKDGFKIKLFCNKLLKYELIHVLGSDAHDLGKRKPEYKKCIEYISKKFGNEYASRISSKNPLKIINGKEIN